jgi:hypothetical protein
MKNQPRICDGSPAILSNDRIERPRCHGAVADALQIELDDKFRLAWFGQAVILRCVGRMEAAPVTRVSESASEEHCHDAPSVSS